MGVDGCHSLGFPKSRFRDQGLGPSSEFGRSFQEREWGKRDKEGKKPTECIAEHCCCGPLEHRPTGQLAACTSAFLGARELGHVPTISLIMG